MSKKINTTSIGLFIVTGITLGVAGLLLFSSVRLFSPTHELIVYFDDSLNGLSVGAPVKYRGVTIGTVKRIMVRFNQAPDDYAMPILIELEERLLKERMPDTAYVFSPENLKGRIEDGLRATLEAESLLTGMLYIGIDIHPSATPPVFRQLKPIYPELPSRPTSIQLLLENLASLDIKAISTNVNNLILKLDASVGRLDVEHISEGIVRFLASTDRLVTSPDITNALASIAPALRQYEELGARLTARVDPLSESITDTLAEADRALAQLGGLGQNLRLMLAPDAPLRNELDLTLQQVAAASQSISELVAFLKRNPNALIAGRKNTSAAQ